ncbi:RDD family protein [Microbispora sp. NBC_01389]|uniref:RDD family protein n=1 Tax=Microbispora sp. NBC_01389 TaxID=2903584 RepID=UPI003255F1A1
MTYGNDPYNQGGYPPQQPPQQPGGQGGYPPPQGGQYGPGQYGGQPSGGYGGPELAHWGLRVGAYLIDALVIGIPSGILYTIGGSMTASSLEVDPDTGQLTSTGGSGIGVVIYFLGLVVALGLTLWLKYREGTTGQTVGKKVLGIKTVKEETGEYIGFGMAFVRYLCHIIDGLPCYIGFLWPLWDAKRQTFADKIVGTVVVRA